MTRGFQIEQLEARVKELEASKATLLRILEDWRTEFTSRVAKLEQQARHAEPAIELASTLANAVNGELHDKVYPRVKSLEERMSRLEARRAFDDDTSPIVDVVPEEEVEPGVTYAPPPEREVAPPSPPPPGSDEVLPEHLADLEAQKREVAPPKLKRLTKAERASCSAGTCPRPDACQCTAQVG
jgi:hypothetical protein